MGVRIYGFHVYSIATDDSISINSDIQTIKTGNSSAFFFGMMMKK